MKAKRFGFTTVELLTVIGIIAMLVSLLIPSMIMVKNKARNTQQRAQITAIEVAMMAFRNDYGDYPPSNFQFGNPEPFNYSGSQMLAEAMLGWDLMGFHPDSAWRADGFDKDDGNLTYDPDQTRVPDTASLEERKGVYLDSEKSNVFRLGNDTANLVEGLFGNKVDEDTNPANTYVICYVYAAKRIRIGGVGGKSVTAGTPILYYKADPSAKNLTSANPDERIYDVYDNSALVDLGSVKDNTKKHWLFYDKRNDPTQNTRDESHFYDYDYEGGIKDSKMTSRDWPHKPDSYILISAGLDGLYGTRDDITNF
ncbi:MAG: type II secretion system protein [Planctomycetota bacterium]